MVMDGPGGGVSVESLVDLFVLSDQVNRWSFGFLSQVDDGERVGKLRANTRILRRWVRMTGRNPEVWCSHHFGGWAGIIIIHYQSFAGTGGVGGVEEEWMGE